MRGRIFCTRFVALAIEAWAFLLPTFGSFASVGKTLLLGPKVGKTGVGELGVGEQVPNRLGHQCQVE